MSEAVRTISIKVNDIAPTKSINEIKKRIKELTAATNDVKEKNAAYYKDIAEIGQLKGALNGHREQIKRISKGWDETKEKVDGYGKSFKNPLSAFLKFENLTVAGLATTLVGAAAAFGAEMVQVSKEINQLRGDIQNLTGKSGEELERLTAKSTALSRVFKDESKEVIQTANSIAKEFSISLDEALDLIEKGYLSGGNAQGDFLEQLREYAPVAKEAKITAEDFTAQIVLASKSGEFADYGQAAIEEALLRLRDMPKATEEAINSIGLSSKDIKSLIEKEGVGAAIKTISSQLNKIEDDAPEMGRAVMGIFGAAGEKVGVQYLKTLQKIGGNLEDLVDKSNDLTNQQLKQLEAEQELATVQTQLSAEIQGLTTGTGVFVTQLKTGLLEIVIAIIRQFQNWIKWGGELYENVFLVRFVVDQTAKSFKTFFTLLKTTPQIANGVVESIKFIYRELQDFGANVVSNAKIAIEQAKNLVGKGDQSIIDKEAAAIKARKDGESIKDAFLKGFNDVKNIAPTETSATATTETSGGSSNQNSLSDFNAPVTSKTIDKNAQNLERLNEQIARFQEDQRLNNLSANTRELEQIRAKYDEQIKIATSLNDKDAIVALEELKNAELQAAHTKHIDAIIAAEEAALEKQIELIDKEADAAIEAQQKQIDDKTKKEEEYQARKREIQNTVNLELMTDLERELLAIDAHYNALIAEAEEYGINLSQIKALEAEKEAKRREHEAKAQEKSDDEQLAAFKERINERASSFQALGSIFGSVADIMVNKEGEALKAQKVFALAEIAMNAAAGISAAIAAGAGIPFPGNIPAIAIGVGAVTTGIAQARKVFADQKKDGGFVEVHGKDDDKMYKAKYIGKASTGMLPNQPVLLDSQVLASEAGQEYFVSNESLKNPLVMDLVKTIDNIDRGFTTARQFKNGGAIGSLPSNDNGLMTIMTQVLNALNRGVHMNVGFKEIEKIQSLSTELNRMK